MVPPPACPTKLVSKECKGHGDDSNNQPRQQQQRFTEKVTSQQHVICIRVNSSGKHNISSYNRDVHTHGTCIELCVPNGKNEKKSLNTETHNNRFRLHTYIHTTYINRHHLETAGGLPHTGLYIPPVKYQYIRGTTIM